jgi:hypothetical protein
MVADVYTSGQVSVQVEIPRWKLLYLIERGDLPGPSLQVPGRRLFTAQDVHNITQALARRPELRGGDQSK